jgi:hypothetical protein
MIHDSRNIPGPRNLPEMRRFSYWNSEDMVYPNDVERLVSRIADLRNAI